MTASKPFARPVVVQFGRSATPRRIATAGDAAECLATVWPLERGLRHKHAIATCLEVLDGRGSSEDARRAFVEAAKESEVLIVRQDNSSTSSEED
ncbi:DUF982 domain-containing protein [Aminobacter sp. HY435]|uniref:DUF982 domain-containing protein n=1 Tax=Aminobacter sp. HY435 TaxID=2970917 RepID=UPI0022B95BD4|nr:DUF982 domain-containing protein [Aminobacter sp. HY435]